MGSTIDIPLTQAARGQVRLSLRDSPGIEYSSPVTRDPNKSCGHGTRDPRIDEQYPHDPDEGEHRATR